MCWWCGGILTGTYEAVLEPPLASAAAVSRQQVGQRRSVTVRPGEQPTDVIFNVTELGSLLIQVRDQRGTALAGTCFGSLTAEDQNGQPLSFCDDDANDQNTAKGRILITAIAAGRYTLAQTVAPSGFQPEAEQTVLITAGTVREIAITNRAEETANLDVVTTDQQGNRLAGACFALVNDATTERACDVDGGEVGVTQFTGVEPGESVVRQLQAPTGPFIAADDRAVRLEPGQTTTATASINCDRGVFRYARRTRGMISSRKAASRCAVRIARSTPCATTTLATPTGAMGSSS